MVFQFAIRFLILTLGVPLMVVAATAHGVAQLTIDADSQYSYAQSRLDEGAVEEAIVEFNRFIHFFPADPRIPEARFQTGMANFNAARYQAATAIFKALTDDFGASPLSIEAYFMLSRSHDRQGMTEQATLDLHNLVALSPSTEAIDQARYELGWLHVDQGRWEQADQAFAHITPDHRDRFQVSGLRQALARSNTIPTKHPTTAGLLSIVPGGGQLYCARYQDALTAFLINTGLIWAAWEAFDNELYALGSVISFVEFGFYAGNIYSGVSSAHKYNRDRSTEFRERLIQPRRIPLSLAPAPGGAVLSLTVDF